MSELHDRYYDEDGNPTPLAVDVTDSRIYVANELARLQRERDEAVRSRDIEKECFRVTNAACKSALDQRDAALSRIETLESDLRDIGAALCTSDGVIIPNELNNLERIDSLRRVLKFALDARGTAEAGLEAAAQRIVKMSREHAEERRTANQLLADEYDARKRAATSRKG